MGGEPVENGQAGIWKGQAVVYVTVGKGQQARYRMVVGCQPYAPAAFTSQEILQVLISVRG